MLETPTVIDCVYAAAWFDSRGYVRLGCQAGRTPRLTLHIQTGLHDTEFLLNFWGGKSKTINRGKYFGNGASVNGRYSWSLDKLSAQKFLQDVAPYVKFRKDLVDRCLLFVTRVRVLNEKANPDLQLLVDEIRQLSRVKTNA